jgi:2-haloacid dehalogenase
LVFRHSIPKFYNAAQLDSPSFCSELLDLSPFNGGFGLQYSCAMNTTTALAQAAVKPRAVIFDAYGTLFDVYSIAALAEQLFPGHGRALSVLWRDKQIDYTRLVTTSNHGAHYQDFWALTQAALAYAIKAIVKNDHMALTLGRNSVSSAFDGLSGELQTAAAQLMAQYKQLSPFPENKAVLEALQARGIPTGILSNGSPDMLDAAVQSAGFGTLLQHVLSVDSIRTYKTHPDAYALGPAAFGLPAAEILFVSSNSWDALAATWYGYQTLWVNRQNLPFDELGTQPTHMGRSLDAVLGVVGL